VIERIWAERFARDWIEAWNRHDLDAILTHYADEISFHSPRIRIVTGAPEDFVRGKAALRSYWSRALSLSSDLHFTFERLYLGSDSATITYRNHRGQVAAETFVFNAQGLVTESIATYA
jgi:ketosteroid isomerase-like protein